MLPALLAGAVLLASGFISRAVFATQTPFQLIVDQATRLLPPRVFAFLLGTLLYWGKPTLLLGLSAGWLLLGVIVGVISGYLVWRRGGSDRQRKTSPSSWTSGKGGEGDFVSHGQDLYARVVNIQGGRRAAINRQFRPHPTC